MQRRAPKGKPSGPAFFAGLSRPPIAREPECCYFRGTKIMRSIGMEEVMKKRAVKIRLLKNGLFKNTGALALCLGGALTLGAPAPLAGAAAQDKGPLVIAKEGF